MSRGFYALTSGMLTQQRKIDISSNNIANMNTAGYKKEQAVTTNFGSLFISKYKQKGIYDQTTPINNVSMIRAMEDNNTIHSQGTLEETGVETDFAILGSGFFRVNNNGNIVYTRNGSFNVDKEGYLELQGVGRVQGAFGDIYVETDKFETNETGGIIVDDEEIDKIALYDFVDYTNLIKSGEGMFISAEEPNLIENPKIWSKTVERSNVNMTEEMTGLVASQRALQTASQALKIYDLVQEKAVSEIGRIN